MTTVTLTEFLLARVAEDEAVAGETHGEHRWIEPDDIHGDSWVITEGDVEFVAYMTPDRVLAECEAKRRIVEMHKPYRRIIGVGCDVCIGSAPFPFPDHPCPTLRLLALPYAGHPDYDEEWKP